MKRNRTNQFKTKNDIESLTFKLYFQQASRMFQNPRTCISLARERFMHQCANCIHHSRRLPIVFTTQEPIFLQHITAERFTKSLFHTSFASTAHHIISIKTIHHAAVLPLLSHQLCINIFLNSSSQGAARCLHLLP